MVVPMKRCRIVISCLLVAGFGSAGALCGDAAGDWRKVKAAALKAARSGEAAERESAFEPFLQHDQRDAAEALVKVINSSRVELPVRRHARDVLSQFRSEGARDAVYWLLRSKPSDSFMLLEAFAAMGDERAPEVGKAALQRVSREEDAGPIVAAAIRCLVASGEPPPEVVASIIERAGDGHPIAVRKAAADALLEIRTPEAAGALIDLVGDAALKDRARTLLVRLAGEDAGPDRDAWTKWWEAREGEMPGGEAISEAAAEELIAAGSEAADEAGGVTFYGVPIEGKNIVFVLDASTSMRGYPLEKLKMECRSLVAQLPETHKFALVFFPRNECFPKELHLADAKTKADAYKFIDKRQVIRGTPTDDAMKFSYRRYVEDGDVDTIYLLSDGRPTNPIPEVLRTIDELNLGRYIAINTIYIGKVPAPDPAAPDPPAEDLDAPPKGPIRTGAGFLKEVARRNGGTFAIVVP